MKPAQHTRSAEDVSALNCAAAAAPQHISSMASSLQNPCNAAAASPSTSLASHSSTHQSCPQHLPCLLQSSEFSQSRQPAAARAVYIRAASGLLLAEVIKYMQAMHSSAVSSSLAAVSSEALDLDEFAGCLKPVQTQPSLSHKPITDKNQVGRRARHSCTACCTRLCPHCQPTPCTGTMHKVTVAMCRRYHHRG